MTPSRQPPPGGLLLGDQRGRRRGGSLAGGDLRRAAGEQLHAVLDGAAVVASGGRIHMIPGERRNLKITTSEDLAYARELVSKGLVAISAVAGPSARAITGGAQ